MMPRSGCTIETQMPGAQDVDRQTGQERQACIRSKAHIRAVETANNGKETDHGWQDGQTNKGRHRRSTGQADSGTHQPARRTELVEGECEPETEHSSRSRMSSRRSTRQEQVRPQQV